MKDFKWQVIFLLPFLLNACIGTDEAEDTISSVEILPPVDVALVEGSFAKLLGQETQLEVQANSDLGGAFTASAENLTWTSGDNTIVTVDEQGMVRAVGVGSATISVVFNPGGVSDDVNISVAGDESAIALIQITSPDDQLVLAPEEEIQLTGVPLNAGGVAVESNEVIEWATSNPDIATVDENGLVSAIAEGEVQITATMAGVTGTIDLIIGDPDQEGGASALSRVGQFQGLTGYQTSGDAILETNPDGSLTLRLGDNFSAQNGPGLYMYLSNDSRSIAGGVELGRLQSTNGAQEYEVPSNVSLNTFNHVILYCRPFGVGFGTAPLSN